MRVLLADDDAVTRRLLEAAIEACGHVPTVVGDGTAAWLAYERERPDMVLLDWQMPGLDGLDVCRRIRAAESVRATFILVVTARQETDDLALALDAGADDFMTKPVHAARLRARLIIAERRIALDATLARALRLAAIGETALAMQHEINNPLAALMGNAEFLLSDGLSAEQEELARAIVEQATRIASVVRRLSQVSEPATVEHIPGARMLDLARAVAPPRSSGRGSGSA